MKKSLEDEELLWKDNREKVLAPRKDASYCIIDTLTYDEAVEMYIPTKKQEDEIVKQVIKDIENEKKQRRIIY